MRRSRGKQIHDTMSNESPAALDKHGMSVLRMAEEEEVEDDGSSASSSSEDEGALSRIGRGAAQRLRQPKLDADMSQRFSAFIGAALQERKVMEYRRGDSSKQSAQATAARAVVRDMLLAAATAPLAGGGQEAAAFVSCGPRSYFALNPSLGEPLQGGGDLEVQPFVVLFATAKRIAPLTMEVLTEALDAVTTDDVVEQLEVLARRHANARGRAKAAAEALTDADKTQMAFAEATIQRLRGLLFESVVDVKFTERIGRKAGPDAKPQATTAEMMNAIRTWAQAHATCSNQRQRKAAALREIRAKRDAVQQVVQEYMTKEDSKAKFFRLNINGEAQNIRVKRKHRPAKYGKKPTMPWAKKHLKTFLHLNEDGPSAHHDFLHGNSASRSAFKESCKEHLMTGMTALSQVQVSEAFDELVVEHPRKRGHASVAGGGAVQASAGKRVRL